MSTFFMFGKYSTDSLKKISADRTRKAINTIQKLGGRVKSVYALLGISDLVFIVNLKMIFIYSIIFRKESGHDDWRCEGNFSW